MTVWYAGWNEIPPFIPDSYLYRVTITRCRIGTVISPDDGHIVARNMKRKAINTLRKNWAPSWFHLQDYTRIHGQQNTKLSVRNLSYPACKAHAQ